MTRGMTRRAAPACGAASTLASMDSPLDSRRRGGAAALPSARLWLSARSCCSSSPLLPDSASLQQQLSLHPPLLLLSLRPAAATADATG